VNLYKGFSLIGFGAKQHTVIFKTPLQAGFSLEYRK